MSPPLPQALALPSHLLRTYHQKSWIVLTSQFYEVSVIITISQMRKLRLRDFCPVLQRSSGRPEIKNRCDPKSHTAVTTTTLAYKRHNDGQGTALGPCYFLAG